MFSIAQVEELLIPPIRDLVDCALGDFRLVDVVDYYTRTSFRHSERDPSTNAGPRSGDNSNFAR
jgi:hypothetical protein